MLENSGNSNSIIGKQYNEVIKTRGSGIDLPGENAGSNPRDLCDLLIDSTSCFSVSSTVK